MSLLVMNTHYFQGVSGGGSEPSGPSREATATSTCSAMSCHHPPDRPPAPTQGVPPVAWRLAAGLSVPPHGNPSRIPRPSHQAGRFGGTRWPVSSRAVRRQQRSLPLGRIARDRTGRARTLDHLIRPRSSITRCPADRQRQTGTLRRDHPGWRTTPECGEGDCGVQIPQQHHSVAAAGNQRAGRRHRRRTPPCLPSDRNGRGRPQAPAPPDGSERLAECRRGA